MIIAEDSALLREGLASLLQDAGLEVTARVGDAEALLNRVAADPPDIVVTDIRMPPTQTTEGLAAAIEILERHDDVAVLVLSQHVEPHFALQLLEGTQGGVGYLLKDRVMDIGEFVRSVERVASGESVVDGEVVSQMLGRQAGQSPLANLTEREREVLSLMAEGWTNTSLAEQLSVSTKTIETHVRNIFLKLGLHADPDEHRRVLAVLTYLRA